MSVKAIALLSGGLDSVLAAIIMVRQGVEVMGLHMVHLFACHGGAGNRPLPAVQAAREIGIPIRLVPNSNEMIETVKSPRYGYGKNFNPCIDCRILTLRTAKQIMQSEEANFIVTGEVIGQRPMSQRLDAIRLVNREAGVRGLVLRPLSAKLMKPTIAEKENWVDRDKLYAISGRSRQPQMELARQFGLTRIPGSAGGCLLTDVAFGKRMRDLAERNQLTLRNAHMAKLGRRLRLNETTRLIVGRFEKENSRVITFARPGDVILEAKSLPGPTAALQGDNDDVMVWLAASIVARYGKGRSAPAVDILYWTKEGGKNGAVTVKPASEDEVAQYVMDR